MNALHVSISLLIVLLLLVVACANNSESSPSPTLTPTQASPTQTVEPVTLQLELTGEPWSDKFMQGLSERTSLEGGMLFDFKETVSFGFQMRETLIPLSIAFISNDNVVVEILDMEPLSVEPYNPTRSYRYAIEVNQGYCTQNEISVGDTVEFQSIDKEGFITITFFKN